MILHTVALGFAVGELILTVMARRGRPRSTVAILASVGMAAAMADSGSFGPRILPTVVWAVILIVISLSAALLARIRSSAPEQNGRVAHRGDLDLSLGLLAMAFLPFLGGGHLAGPSGAHAHGQASPLLAVLVIALIITSAALAVPGWRGRAGLGNGVEARACMLCSLTTMMAATLS
jgi:hypothetical protein